MPISETQIIVALLIALFPGLLAFRLATELYKQTIRLKHWKVACLSKSDSLQIERQECGLLVA